MKPVPADLIERIVARAERRRAVGGEVAVDSQAVLLLAVEVGRLRQVEDQLLDYVADLDAHIPLPQPAAAP